MILRTALNLSVVLLFLLTGCSRGPQGELIPYEALLKQLADPVCMARLDQPGAKLVSSYDRTGGNNDYNHFLRSGPDGWVVLADLKGPGYVSRFWFTGSKDGSKKIRLYFDGERSPSIETTMDEWCGRKAPFTMPLAGYEPYCWYSWLPVPYKKRLVIMEEAPVQDEKLYYHICYNELPAGQTVDSFKMPLSAAAEKVIGEVKERWNSRQLPLGEGAEEHAGHGVLNPKSKTKILELSGPALMRELQFTPDWSGFASPSQMEKALRELVVRVYWDNCAEPSVEAPLGALCGSMWRRMRYHSLYFGATDETLSLRFPMPFHSSAVVEIENAGNTPVPVSVSASVQSSPSLGSEYGFFHSGWKSSPSRAVGSPHTILQTKGSGKFVGCILGVRSQDRSWWVLEGDELILVDDEQTPGWKGTGLEDYFNGGWYYANALASPLNGMVFKAPFRVVQYRLHQADPVAFSHSFDMIFERGPDHANRAQFESVSFYYLARPQAVDSDVGKQPFHPEPDPLSQLTLMTEINNMERLGDYTAAHDLIPDFLEQFGEVPFAEALRRRMENYHRMEPVPEGKALLGVYANMPATVYLNGHLIGRFGDPQAMQFKTIELGPGRHVLAVQTARQHYPDWVQVALKYGERIIGTDNTWKFSFRHEAYWSATDFDDSGWTIHDGKASVKGPPEVPYVFCLPNEYPGMQSVPWGMRPPVDWPPNAQQAFYRKEFVLD